MSIAEIERFATDMKSNEGLRAEAEKAKAEKSMVAFAATKGYAFNADEVKEYDQATAKTAGREVTDAELDGVAGGHKPDGGAGGTKVPLTTNIAIGVNLNIP